MGGGCNWKTVVSDFHFQRLGFFEYLQNIKGKTGKKVGHTKNMFCLIYVIDRL